MTRILLVFALLWVGIEPLLAKTLILKGPVRESLSLREWEDFYRDSTGQLTLGAITTDPNIRWRPLPRPMLGISSDVLWIRMEVQNATAAAMDILIEDRWAQTNLLELHVLHGGQHVEQQKSGDHVPLMQRHVPYRYPVFDVKLPPGASSIYLRYQSNDLLSSRLFLSNAAVFNETRELEKLVFGLLLGVLLIMPLYNFMLYFLLKDSSYLYYSSYGLLYALFQACVNGLVFQYVLDAPWVNDELAISAVFVCVFFVYRFAGKFLELKQRMPEVNRTIVWFGNMSLLSVLFTFVHLGATIMVVFATNICLVGWMLYTSFVLSRRGYKPAIFFLVAWILFVIGDSFTMLGYMGFMEDGQLTQFGMLAGSMVEEVLISLAMGYKFEELRQALTASEVEKSKLIGSMESARILQESLVSRHVRSAELEVASYYRSAEQAGGDWYSIVDRPDKNLVVFALGDVTGHGLSSSMMTAFACGAFEASVLNLDWQDDHLEESLGRLAITFNQLLYRTANTNDRLMTMSVFALDLRHLRGYYVNCGHHASYLLGQERLAPIFKRGSILGVERDKGTFPVLTFDFKVGDTILLHSDGLVENGGPSGAHFPMHRVQKLLQYGRHAEDNLQALIEGAEAIWKGQQPDDDVTVLMMRIVAAAQDQDDSLMQSA